MYKREFFLNNLDLKDLNIYYCGEARCSTLN